MKAGRLSRAARFHIDILINQDWNQFILMNAGIQALTLTLSLTLPPLMRSMPLPPMLTFWSVSEKMQITLLPVCESVFVIISHLLPSLRLTVPRQRAGLAARALKYLAV